VKTIMRLFILSELSIFMSKVDKRFIREGIELWASFILPRRPNIEPLSCGHDELKDPVLDLILVKTEGLCWVSTSNIWKTEDFGVLPFPTLLNTEGRCCKVEDYNLSNTKDVYLFLTSSSSLSVVSLAAMYWKETAYLYATLRFELVEMVHSQGQPLEVP